MSKKHIHKRGLAEELDKFLSKVTHRHLVIVIIIASFAVYFNALFNGFVYDDLIQVLKNRWIKDIKYIPEIFSSSVWNFSSEVKISNYYRPLMHILYMIDYHIFGLNPWGFHLMNILFHAGTSVLVFLITSYLFRESKNQLVRSNLFPAFLASLLFVTHPVHTEAVTWVAGLPELSFTFFSLLSLYFYIRSEGRLNSDYIFSAASFFVATLCKETALTLPVMLLVYDYAFGKGPTRLLDRLMRYVPYLVLAGVYLILRMHALGSMTPIRSYGELSNYQYVINVFPLFTRYLEKLLLPVNLNLWHVFNPISSLLTARGVISLSVAAAFLCFALLALRKDRLIFFGLLLIGIPLFPAFYIPGIGGKPFAERYLYLPSFGFVILLTLFFDKMRAAKPKVIIPLTVISVILIGLYSLGTISRNTIWKSDYILFSDTVKKSPNNAQLREFLGNALSDMGRIDEAIEQYRTALALDPYFIAEIHNNLGNAFFKKGWIDKAIEHYEMALTLKPELAEVHNNLGIAYGKMGLIDRAIGHFETAVRLQPDYIEAHFNLGVSYIKNGLIDQAIGHFETAAKMDPDNPAFRNTLFKAYEQKRLSR